ncbi:MAG: hypothetical protein IPP71_16400 [Bacteroidetes bacterium]|nr:hypothetical protein [Bacteroidota bacterium]
MKSEPKILVLLFISYVTLLVAVIGFSGYNGLYGQDSHEYLRYCNQLIAFLKKGADPGNYFWTVAYPLTGAFLSFLIGSKLAMLLIPVLSAAWILVLVTSYLMNEFPGREREVSIYSFLFLGLSPYFFRYSISIMSDIPATAFLVTAWYFADRFIKVRKVTFFSFTIVSVALAVFFRISLVPLTVPVFVFIGVSLFYNFDFKNSFLLRY